MRVADAPDQYLSENGAAAPGGPRRAVRRIVASRGARQGVLALVDQCLASATTFLTMTILARSCTQDEVGIFSLCFSMVLFACMIQERTLSAPYLMFAHQRRGEAAATLLGSTLVHQSILAVAVVVVEWGYFGYLLETEGFSTMAASVLALTLVTLPVMLRDFVRSVSFAHLRMSGAILVDGVVSVLQLGTLAALAAWGTVTIPKAFLAMGVACVFAAAAWLLTKRHPLAIRREQIRLDWRHHWGYARWLVFGRLFGNGSRLFMPWIVAGMLGLSSAGVLAACVTLAGLSWVFVRGMNNLLQPRAVRAYHHGGKVALLRELWRTAIFYVVFLGGMCVVYVFAGRWLLQILFGEGFTDGAPALVMLGLNTLATGLAMTSSNGLAALERPKGNFLGEGATFLLTIGLAFPLIRAFGIAGAAAALVAGAVSSLIVMTWVLARALRRVDTA